MVSLTCNLVIIIDYMSRVNPKGVPLKVFRDYGPGMGIFETNLTGSHPVPVNIKNSEGWGIH